MTKLKKLKERITGLSDAIARYPLTALLLLAAAAVNAVDISSNDTYIKYVLVFVVGAMLSAVFQAVYERFATKASVRAILMAVALLLAGGYYLLIRTVPTLSEQIGIRTGIALFALWMAFIWLPVFKSRVSFNESFLAAFKALFVSLFFAGVIWGGVSLIWAATDRLLFSLPYTAYAHTANIVFVIFAPMYFLALIPVYPGKASNAENSVLEAKREEYLQRAANYPKFLEILISYIIIPIVAVFTLILVIYIILNIGGNFWTDNLLEPMLVSYAIAVILVSVLASRLENKFAVWFRKIFPKVLVPIVIFQIIASVLRLGDVGLTHTRYFVILFGIFAAAAGIVLSIVPVRKNGIVAAMLIVFALVAIIPPVDAFTVSRSSQINMLEKVLVQNGMLENGKVKANAEISNEDKQKITETMYYLERMDYVSGIAWLPEDFDTYTDFYKTFGFSTYDTPNPDKPVVYINLDRNLPVNISGYDTLVNTYIAGDAKSGYAGNTEDAVYRFQKAGTDYILQQAVIEEQYWIELLGPNGEKLLRVNTEDIFEHFGNYGTNKAPLTPEEASVLKENDAAAMLFLVQNLNMDGYYAGAEVYLFIKIK